MWMKIFGDVTYVIKAFKNERKYVPPDCKHYLTDYSEFMPDKSKDLYDMAIKLKELGVIDGIGMEFHLSCDYPDIQLYNIIVEKFVSTGLEIQFTELDICIDKDDEEKSQASKYKVIFSIILKYADNIPLVTLWDTHDSEVGNEI